MPWSDEMIPPEESIHDAQLDSIAEDELFDLQYEEQRSRDTRLDHLYSDPDEDEFEDDEDDDDYDEDDDPLDDEEEDDE